MACGTKAANLNVLPKIKGMNSQSLHMPLFGELHGCFLSKKQLSQSCKNKEVLLKSQQQILSLSHKSCANTAVSSNDETLPQFNLEDFDLGCPMKM